MGSKLRAQDRAFESSLSSRKIHDIVHGPLFRIRRRLSVPAILLREPWPLDATNSRNDWIGYGSTVGIGTAYRPTCRPETDVAGYLVYLRRRR